MLRDNAPAEAIVLAGGLGTRLRSVVSDVPKPMAPIAGRPFLEYLFDYWISQGISRFTLSVGYRHETITSHFGDVYRGASLRYFPETTPLGTGGALLNVLGGCNITAPVLLLNGDTYFSVDLGELSAFGARNEADIAFALFETDEPARYLGLDLRDDGRILGFEVQNGLTTIANGGVYWLRPQIFAERSSLTKHPRSLEIDLLPALLRAGRKLYGRVFSDTFIDIGVPEDFHRAQDVLASVQKAVSGSC